MTKSRSMVGNFGMLVAAALIGAGGYAWLQDRYPQPRGGHRMWPRRESSTSSWLARPTFRWRLARHRRLCDRASSALVASNVPECGPNAECRAGETFPRSCVRFSTTKCSRGFFRFDIPQRDFEQQGQGSGVIISRDGYVLTNNHVVAGADELTVTLFDKRQIEADVVGTDPKTDLAVLKIDADGLTRGAGSLDRSEVQVGQWGAGDRQPISARADCYRRDR